MLDVRDLTVRLGGRTVVQDASLQVGAGEIVGVMGQNGAGKTSLARAISGFLSPAAGSVWLGHNGSRIAVTGLSAWRCCRHGLAYVPAERPIFETLTVRENLEVVRAALPRSAAREFNLPTAFDSAPQLAKRLDQLAGTLSGGERRLLAVARAMLLLEGMKAAGAAGTALILDEPTHGLSPAATDELATQLLRLAGVGTAVLVLEQNQPFAARVANRTYTMDLGHLAAILLPPEVAR